MTGWLTAWGKPVPSASGGMDMGGMSHGTAGMMSDADMAKLKGAKGKTFDVQFCTMMIAHHQGAILIAKDELANGANADAKKLAQQIITGQQARIGTMNAIVGRL